MVMTSPNRRPYVNYFYAVNLYGASMCKLLPGDDFRFLSDEEIATFEITKVDLNGSTGYMVQADILFPPELHDKHNCLPLAPSHLEITKDMLSNAAIVLGENLGLKFGSQRKLVPTLHDKEKYICHSSILKFYIEQGFVLKKIHNILAFTQSAWLASFINFNTERRKIAFNSFTKDFYELMSNAVSNYLSSFVHTLIISCLLECFNLNCCMIYPDQ